MVLRTMVAEIVLFTPFRSCLFQEAIIHTLRTGNSQGVIAFHQVLEASLDQNLNMRHAVVWNPTQTFGFIVKTVDTFPIY